jgi:hypothetical protein
MIFQETETIGHLRAAGYSVFARCSRCDSDTLLNLEALEAEKGALFTFWNKHPPCPKNCGEAVTFQAKMAAKDKHGRAWPIHMTKADPDQVAFIEARWRADRINNDLGGRMGLRLAVEALRFVRGLGVGAEKDWNSMIDKAVETLPPERQDDGRWLIRHYIDVGGERRGWR